MEPFLIPDNLECHKLLRFMIKGLDYLSKRALSKSSYNFESIHDLIMNDQFEISAFVIKPVVAVETLV